MPPTSIEPAMSLELRIRAEHESMVLHCIGQIVSGETSQAFRSAVVDLLHQHPNVIVDLREISRMDRSGLETLVSLYSSARTAKATVKFENLTVEVSDSYSRRSQFQIPST